MKSNDNQTFRTGCTGTNCYSTEVSGPIDVKDLGIIQDQLIHEALAFKKWTVYENSFTDTQLKQIAQRTADHHKQHFDTLQNYLNSHH